MKDNKGFTLVELLAVIAILALLVIITLPKIIDLYNSAKKSSFLTEANEIYKEVNVIQIKESIKGNNITEISNDNNSLDLADNVTYNIKINSDGKISEFYLTNGSYTVCGKGNNFDVKELTEDSVKEGIVSSEVCIESYLEENDSDDSDEDDTNIVEEPETVDTNVLAPESCYVVSGNTITDYNTSYSSNCPKNLKIPSVINGNTITAIGNAAFFHDGLTSVTIPNTVTSIGFQAFDSNNLTAVTIPDSVTTIGGLAFENNQLTRVKLSNNLVSIDSRAFSKNKLTTLNIPSSVTYIDGDAFNNNLLPDSEAFIYKRTTSGIDYSSIVSYGGARRDNVVIPSSSHGVALTQIEGWAFFNCDITSVTIPNGITSIGVGAFMYNNLRNITIPDTVTFIDRQAFMYNQLTTVTIPSSVTGMSLYPFLHNQLTSVIIKGKSSSSEFRPYYSETWGWADNVTCVKDNTNNVTNGCIHYQK